jgi:radical SAM superfamily enzyme YgiQ (UPF0313 family)
MKQKATSPASTGGSRRLRMLFFLDYDNGQGGRFSNSPGLLPFIGYTRRAGFDVDFVDSESQMLEELATREVDVVGISSMERLLPRSVAVARKVRQARPDVVLILGGNSIETFACELATLFDIVVTGEGEHALPALLRAIARERQIFCPPIHPSADFTLYASALPVATADPGGALLPTCVEKIKEATFRRTVNIQPPVVVNVGVGGIYVRDAASGQIWHMREPERQSLQQASEEWLKQLEPERANAARSALSGLSTTTAPLEEELDEMCVYPWDLVESHSWSTLEFYTQRGCKWGRCEFCSIDNRNVRALTQDKVIEVLKEAASHGATMISFSDDLFVQNPEWNRELLERLLPLDLNLKFRAQTMATRTVWPLLDLMQRVGFVELAFGVETLNAERARFMVKSYNGQKYVENAKETIAKVAEAGICPVLYMIMVDPRSTLLEITGELADIVVFVSDIYRRTAVVPKLSYTLMMLPVAGPVMTSRFPYTTVDVDLGRRGLSLPAEFKIDPAIAAYLRRIAHQTCDMPYRRENLNALFDYLTVAAEVAEETGDQNLDQIRGHAERGLSLLKELTEELNEDVENTARDLLALNRGEIIESDYRRDILRFEFTRFGGYIAGVRRYFKILEQASG